MTSKILHSIRSLAPIMIYSRSKSQRSRIRRMKKMIHSELFQIWRNVSDIVQPPVSSIKDNSNLRYPTVDWSVVNKRFVSNIPTPTPQPCHGCSEDPAFYETIYERSDYGYHRNMGSKFTNPNPFGVVSGYLTDAGVIAIPDKVFHGHIYQEGVGWILHAEFSKEKEIQKKETKMKKKRKK